MAWVETALAAGELTALVVRRSRWLMKIRRQLWYRVRNGGAAAIPVLGAGGVGKTVLSDFLSSGHAADAAPPYRESQLVDRVKLKGDVPGVYIVAPGQRRRLAHWDPILQRVIGGGCFGVVNVVAYGFHSFAGLNSYKEHALYSTGMSPAAFALKYAAHNRGLELDYVKRIADALVLASGPLWMMTVINKRDLWWDRREEVRRFYEKGLYNKAIRRIATRLGSRMFFHDFVPVSLAVDNFRTPAGELVFQTVAGYGQKEQVAQQQCLLSTISGFLSRGRKL